MRTRDEVRAELQSLASAPSLVSRAQSLNELALALDGPDAHHWSRLDLLALFPESSVSPPQEAGLVRAAVRWEQIRNTLILVPLLVTWLGIALAVSAYGTVLEQSPELGDQPFIQLWEQGFDDVQWSIPFSTIGVLDLVAICCVVGSSVMVGRIRRRLEVESAAEGRLVWNRLQLALTEASVHLAAVAFDSPLRFNEAMTKAVSGLGTVSAGITSSASSVTALLGATADSVAHFESGTAALVDTTKDFSESSLRMETAVQGLSTRLNNLEERFGPALADTARMVDAQQQVIDQMSESLATVSSVRGDLSNAMEDVGRLLEQLVTERAAQGDAAAAIGSARDSLGSIATSLQSAVASADEAVTRSSAAAVDVQSAALGLAGAAGAVDRAASTIEQAVGESLAGLPAKLDEVSQELKSVSRATVEGGDRVNEAVRTSLSKTTDQLRVAADALTAVIDPLKGLIALLPLDSSGTVSAADGLNGNLGPGTAELVSELQATNAELRSLAGALAASGQGRSGAGGSSSAFVAELEATTAELRHAAEALSEASTGVRRRRFRR
jgi:hypothetical protein